MAKSLDEVLSNATTNEVEVDFSGAVDFEPLPKGQYVLRLTEAAPGESKEGNPKIVWKFVVVEPASHVDRVLFRHTPTTGKGSGLTKQVLEAFGVNVSGDKQKVKPSSFVGKTVLADVDLQKDNPEFNEIKRMRPHKAASPLG